MQKFSPMIRAASRLLLSLIGFLLASSVVWAASGAPAGVYGCYDAKMDYKMQLVITPMPFVMFGIIDGNTYADYDGHRGHYSYDPSSGMLTMTDGSRQGWRYHNSGDWSFRLIDNQTGSEIYTCPLDPKKDPARGPW